MYKNKKIICIIPARKGSKGLKDKNIYPFLKKPLIYFSIKQALSSKYIDKIVFSTDSNTYASIAKKYGINVPELRPKKYSTDYVTDLKLFKYELIKSIKEGFKPDIYVNLRPTSPIRTHLEIDKCIEHIINNNNIDSVRSVHKNNFVVQKTWFIKRNILHNSINHNSKIEEWNLPRQKLKPSYMQNGSIDIGRVKIILKNRSMTGKKIKPFIQNHFCDIDNLASLKSTEKFAKKSKILDKYL